MSETSNQLSEAAQKFQDELRESLDAWNVEWSPMQIASAVSFASNLSPDMLEALTALSREERRVLSQYEPYTERGTKFKISDKEREQVLARFTSDTYAHLKPNRADRRARRRER